MFRSRWTELISIYQYIIFGLFVVLIVTFEYFCDEWSLFTEFE